MPRDAHGVHSEALFAVAGLTPTPLGSQCKTALAEAMKYILRISSFQSAQSAQLCQPPQSASAYSNRSAPSAHLPRLTLSTRSTFFGTEPRHATPAAKKSRCHRPGPKSLREFCRDFQSITPSIHPIIFPATGAVWAKRLCGQGLGQGKKEP